jgi:hypothetical protein
MFPNIIFHKTTQKTTQQQKQKAATTKSPIMPGMARGKKNLITKNNKFTILPLLSSGEMGNNSHMTSPTIATRIRALHLDLEMLHSQS